MGLPRIDTLKRLIVEAEKYLDDPDKGKRKAAEEIIGVLELQLNDRQSVEDRSNYPSVGK